MRGWLSIPPGLALAVLPATGQKGGSTVVFVCPHGAAKSVIAAAYFNQMSVERGLPNRAVARGTEPGDALSQTAVNGLVADGLPAPAGKPQAPRKSTATGIRSATLTETTRPPCATIAGLVTKLLDSMAPAKRP